MKRRIDLILNGKGGVGKSFFATNFVQYLKDRQIDHIAIDTDNENSTLKRFHPDAQFVDLKELQQIDSIFQAFETTSLVVVDGRAASSEFFMNYFVEVGAFEILKELGAELTLICPVGHESDSVEQIASLSTFFEDRCGYVIVRNQFLSDSFAIFDQSQARKRLLEQLHAREIMMPKLYGWLVAKLNSVDFPITPALQHRAFSVMDRQRLKNWQNIVYDQIDSVRTLLLPEDHDSFAVESQSHNELLALSTEHPHEQ